MRPRHVFLVLAIVIALVAMAVIVVLVMSMISIVMSLISMVVVAVVVMRHFMTMIFMSMVLGHLTRVIVVAVFFCPDMLLMAQFAVFFSYMLVMALFTAYLIPFMRPIRNFVSMVFPHEMMLRIVMDGIRMVIFVAVHPRALPRCVIDENDATVPGNVVVSPSPWPI